MNIKEIAISLVDDGPRLRGVDEDKARMIAASMREVGGQLTPIEVRPADEKGIYRLVSGAHRLRAVRINAVEHAMKPVVQAVIRKSANDDEALLREIDENLTRAELTPLDRATFLAERKRIYLKLHPETARGGDRKSNRHDGALISEPFSKATADRIGLSERTIQRACTLYDRLDAGVRLRLTGTKFADRLKDLLDLAEQPGARQIEIAELLLAHGSKVTSVAAAIRQLDGAMEDDHQTPDQKAFSQFKVIWEKHPRIRADIRAYVAKRKPAGEQV